MLKTVFKVGTATYTIVHPISLREWHERCLDIRPDPSLWTSRQKRVAAHLQLEEGQKRGPRGSYKK